MSTYTQTQRMTGFADSAIATGRFGRSAFNLLVDFAKVGAPVGTGLVSTDVIASIGGLPQNCVVRTVVAQVVRPITVLAATAPSAIPITLKAGATTLASLALSAINGPSLGAQWTDVSLSDGGTGIAGTKADLSLTVGAVLDSADIPAATAITGGALLLTFFVDYIPEADELAAWFTTINEISDGGNTATEIVGLGLTY